MPERGSPPPSKLTAVSHALTFETSTDEALEIAVDSASELLKAEKVLLMLEGDDGRLHIRACRGFSSEAVERFCEPLDERLIDRLRSAFGPDVEERFLGVPLVVRSRVVGLLSILREEAGITEDDESLLSALADQLAPALDGDRLRRRRQELRTQLEELERLAGQKEDALRMLDHDLRSPMSALRGYVDMLLNGVYGPLEEAQRRTVSRIHSISRHVAGLLANVNAMTELSAGAVRVEPAPTLVLPVIEEAVDVVRFAADLAGVTFRADVETNLTILADGNRLRQVLVQVLENAVKYAPAHSGVSVSATTSGPWAEIRVADEGPGIPADDAERIFEPYERLPGTAGAEQGAGLGLFLGRSLVELMGGTLTVEPTDRPGATLLVRLPLP